MIAIGLGLDVKLMPDAPTEQATPEQTVDLACLKSRSTIDASFVAFGARIGPFDGRPFGCGFAHFGGLLQAVIALASCSREVVCV